MNGTLRRVARIPVVVAAVWGVLAFVTPIAMAHYAPYQPRAGISCFTGRVTFVSGVPQFDTSRCASLAEIYRLSFTELMADAMLRSLVLLVGAGILALFVGTLVGVAIALLRRRALAAGAAMGLTSLITAVPAFFVAYFLQMAAILYGSSATGARLLPVYGFGYDEHIVLPLISISIPAIAYTAQLTATRMQDVLDSDFVTTATAKGLATSWILGVHVLPHVRPILLEGLGSGLRVSLASLPIVEFLFNWRGIGQLALEAVGVHDAAGFVFAAVVFASLFTVLSTVADLSRPRALYAR